jgi:hypothetical protein
VPAAILVLNSKNGEKNMKPKKINKKLVLNKETISTLVADQMKKAKGGVSRTCGTHFCETEEPTCMSCINTECACSNPCISKACTIEA